MKYEQRTTNTRARQVLDFFDEWFGYYRGTMHYEAFREQLNYYSCDKEDTARGILIEAQDLIQSLNIPLKPSLHPKTIDGRDYWHLIILYDKKLEQP